MASKEPPTPRSRDPSPAASKRSSEAGPGLTAGLGAADNSLPEIKRYVRQQVVTVPVGAESPSKGVPTLQLKVFHEGQSMTLSDAMRHRPSGVYFCKKPTAAGLDSELQLPTSTKLPLSWPCLHQMAHRAALRPRPRPVRAHPPPPPMGPRRPKGPRAFASGLALRRPCGSGRRHCLLHRSLLGDAPQLARPDRHL